MSSLENMSPLEKNGRRIIGILAKSPGGTATPQELRLGFEKSAHLRKQSFYNALNFIKERQWVLKDGKYYFLNPDDSWREPEVSIGTKLERSKQGQAGWSI
jgi:hypothetical protein